MRRVWTVALLAALLAFAVEGVAPAAANPKFFGVHYTTERFSLRDVHRMDRGRVGIVRRLLYWPGVETTRGNFHWGVTDEIVGELASRGIRWLPIVYGSPRFVSHRPTSPPVGSKHKRRLWQRFLREAVKRYRPGGTYWTTPSLYPHQHPGHRPVPVRAWQIWNEPNLVKFFTPHPSVGRYAHLVASAHRAIKGADRHAEIVLAGLSGRGNPPAKGFLDRFYRVNGIKHSFESVAVNPYARRASGVGAKIKKIRGVMKRHHDKRSGVWITELGWGSHPPDRFGLNKGVQGQKRILKQSFRLIRRHRRGWHVEHLIWFDFRDPPHNRGGCSFCTSAGLFKHNGHPKPAWRAFKGFTHARH